MPHLTADEQRLLERLGAEGKAVELMSGEISAAKSLEPADLIFLVPDGSGKAIITPKGRRLLAQLARKPPKPPKPPLGFLD
jgi:hypothetical protein